MTDLSSLYAPDSIAVVGASASRGKVGNAVVRNLLKYDYPGKIYPVNPKEDQIEGLACYPSVGEIPDQVVEAVICVPAVVVPDVARECGEAGVQHLVVLSAGFKETGHEGAELERHLAGIAGEYGMTLMGPNSLGVMDTHTPINASFTANFPLKGEIAFFSQSGALCAAILDWSLQRGLGFSKFISLGNKAQLNEAHFIEDAADDPNSKVILLYLESVEDGPAFLRAARRASRKKPVLVIKAGVSTAGAQAASSHTGALAGSDAAYSAAFRQAGIIRTSEMEELFNLATAFVSQPLPGGPRVLITTNAGGPGIVSTDNVELKGLEMARFSQETLSRLEERLPAAANMKNPVDVIGDADIERYRYGLATALADEHVDMALPVLCPTAFTDPVATSRDILALREEFPGKPIVAVYTGGEAVAEGARVLSDNGVPCFFFPEPAVRCLQALYEYRGLKERADQGEALEYEGDQELVRGIFTRVREDDRTILLGPEAMAVAAAYGIDTVPSHLATSAGEAGEYAEDMGYPVVLKIASPEIVHKTDIGGVKLGLKSRPEVEEAFEEIMSSARKHEPEARLYGVEVQKMAPKGEELIVGLLKDPTFGALLMFGMGGVYVDLMKDVGFRLADGLTDIDVDEMVRETKAYRLLTGYRGAAEKDVETVKETIGRIGRLARDFPEIAELDINPFFAYERGVKALDVKITLTEE